MIIDKLFTWVDVQDVLEDYFRDENNENWLDNISFQCYWDGLTISYCTADSDLHPKNRITICAKLEEIFLARLQREGNSISIILDGNKEFPVIFEEVEKDEINKVIIKPSLSRLSFISKKERNFGQERSSVKSPFFYAFHSFKGGVGRTLHAIGFAIQLSEKYKVLLIDADFEAPGITWLVNNPQISFADVLTLIHGSKNPDLIVKQISGNLKNDSYEKNNLYILPAYRGLKSGNLPVLEIKPEHIYKFSKNPFILTDFLEKLANELNVDYIVIDLRAGLSELSSGWFFDPRINKVFVTTLSSQSLLGTKMMFSVLSKFEKEHKLEESDLPYLIISQVPKEILTEMERNWTGSYLEGLIGELREQFQKSFIDLKSYQNAEGYKDFTEEEILGRVVEPLTLFSVENDNLKFLPGTWDEVIDVIVQNNLPKETLKLNKFLPEVETNQKDNLGDLISKRKLLQKKAHSLVYADQTEEKDFLPTNSIINLVEAFRSQVPIAVVVGAKGSGKTFLFKQICYSCNWAEFSRMTLPQSNNNNEAFVLPVILPQNLSDNRTFITVPKEIQKITNAKIHHNIWSEYIQGDIELSLKNDLTNTPVSYTHLTLPTKRIV